MISGPQTAGNGVAGNPMYDSQDPSSDASRIIAFGLRNPFRFTFRPGTSEPWVGDVGWNTWEEVNPMTSTTPASPVNFGWPCYEGVGRMSSYDSANLTICENLYTDTVHPATGPYYAYQHGVSVVSGDACPLNSGSVISGITFYAEGSYPGSYNGALFFGDHSRNCIWAMMPAGNGLPNAGNLQAFVVDPNSHPVDLETDPASGDVFHANFDGGQIRRLQYLAANNPPSAVATANPTSGPAPLTVQFTESVRDALHVRPGEASGQGRSARPRLGRGPGLHTGARGRRRGAHAPARWAIDCSTSAHSRTWGPARG